MSAKAKLTVNSSVQRRRIRKKCISTSDFHVAKVYRQSEHEVVIVSEWLDLTIASAELSGNWISDTFSQMVQIVTLCNGVHNIFALRQNFVIRRAQLAQENFQEVNSHSMPCDAFLFG